MAVQLLLHCVLFSGFVQDSRQHSCLVLILLFRKNQNGFRKNRSTTSQILTIRRTIEEVKNLGATLFFIDISKAFDSIYREKMEQILLKCGFLKETVTPIMMLYKNTKAMILITCWRHRHLRHCHRGLSRRFISPIFVYILLRLRILNIHWSNKRKCFHIINGRKQTIYGRNSCKYTSPGRIPGHSLE